MLVALRVLAVVVDNLEGQVGRPAGVDTDEGLALQQVQLLANLVEARYLVQQTAAGIVEHRALFLLVPVFAQQLVHLPVLVFLEGHILSADNHVANLGDAHIVTRRRIILHAGGHTCRGVARAHGGIGRVRLSPQDTRSRQQRQE